MQSTDDAASAALAPAPAGVAVARRQQTPWRGLGPRALRDVWRAVDDEAARARQQVPGVDRGPFVAFVVGALALVVMEYVGVPATLAHVLEAYETWRPGLLWGPTGLYASRWLPLLDLGWWIGWRLIGFFVIPALAIRWFLGERVRDHGLGLGLLRQHAPGYLMLFALVAPIIALAALRPEFKAYYPFYRLAGYSLIDLVLWELLYAAQFVALEFFFRGFWLESCRKSLGSHAIFAMVVPYCMIHFTKPVLEVLAAIPAGIVLGTLAMRTRSIWGGAAVHIAVALSMDLLALAQGTGIPTRLWPP